MRLRIYKRKVLALLLALGAAACALVLWGGAAAGGEAAAGGSSSSSSKREEPPPPPPPGDQPVVPPASSAPARGGRLSNSSWPLAPQEAGGGGGGGGAGNGTRHYRSLVYRLNFDQPVRNEALWGRRGAAAAAAEEVPVALVVQVHERAEHLRLLLDSLRRAPGAEKVLLVLSHDVWSAELNALAASVDFCAVLQVFFPFSLQLYPGEFPGTDPRDCPRDVGQAAALRLGCLNAQYPDAFGHYREAAFAQTKHHWWWKLHFVWERVRALRRHPGLVLFLEEDHYLAPDFHHVLQRLWALRQRDCPECQVLSLGSYAAVRGSLAGRADKAELKTWKSTEHNMGLAFARDTYEQLLACTEAFCTYDDYNWDWTLQHLTISCLPRFWKVLVPETPRVFHTGDCGMHHKKSCRPSAQSAKIDSLLSTNRQHLFPEAMAISKRYALAPLSPHVKNGGWGDIRDHELCKSYRRLQ
ncbi:alpha-1,6-mannosyl-glycoprotein 2-beta-N-acetylglucosaminyltransferase [Hemicordylus capensis]|uniref:alpha-1,6-mannosyl-glycoprotein 2-beta-N-acetylglucosaminyltransferase n=1 Tax=Hemicordylus capensis TaxID=884348 RepID=UPI002304A190|nr:alpha-1,6-mannosyl-glycoprotein 2-beta-N-acetylglucosaminyltransferase [Hemicordylus capensis]